MTAYAAYASQPAHKLLTDNRDLYIAQSAATRNGKVPPLRIVHGDQPDGAHIADSPLAGRHSFNKDSQ
jgi:hypothetical protein